MHRPNDKKQLCIAAGFDVQGTDVWAYNRKFPLADPLAIHLNVYRTDESKETRYQAFYNTYCTLWPEQVATYNYWLERIFREHCDDETEIFTLAGGGGLGKTYAASKMACIFWLANPTKRTVITTSTTVESLKSRIFGYIQRDLKAIKHIQLPLSIKTSPPPSIAFRDENNKTDGIHGIFGLAAKQGDDERTIQDLIGRHPEDAILVILDEAPDMPIAIMNALPNLKKGLRGKFQVCAIGNAASVSDLHGALSTPKVGWDNIDPHKEFRWPTTQSNGYCLYFNPYDSPAIHEPDTEKRERLSSFMMTAEKLVAAEQSEGTDSDAFWRFTMGYWRVRSIDKTVFSEAFLKDYDPTKPAEFSGVYPLGMCAGLDPSFSSGGDKCILQLGILGHHTNGKVVLDFKGSALTFNIKISVKAGQSIETQIAAQVIEICKNYNIPLNTVCIDASGQGRGLAQIIQLQSGSYLLPTKIYSSRVGNHARQTDPTDLIVMSSYELWDAGRKFVATGQICGINPLAYAQLYNRKIVETASGKKTLETKIEYKKRMSRVSGILGTSPDEADAAMLCIQSAILHHGWQEGQSRPLQAVVSKESRDFQAAVKQYQERQRTAVNFNSVRPDNKNGIETLIGKQIIPGIRMS